MTDAPDPITGESPPALERFGECELFMRVIDGDDPLVSVGESSDGVPLALAREGCIVRVLPTDIRRPCSSKDAGDRRRSSTSRVSDSSSPFSRMTSSSAFERNFRSSATCEALIVSAHVLRGHQKQA